MDDKELFRLASLVGCEPEDEERHRKDLLAYLKKHFEANMLDGFTVETCGRNMMSVDSVWEYLQEVDRLARIDEVIRGKTRTWTPTEGYSSEEEKGFQEGIIAQIRLSQKASDERIAQLESEK